MNQQILDQFDKLIKITNDKIINGNGEKNDEFRLKSYKNAYKIISKYKTEIKDGEELKKFKGIGEKIIDKVNQILISGSIQSINNITTSNSSNIINELTTVVNIGTSKAKELVTKHNIQSIEDLISKHAKGEIELNKKIEIGLKYYNILQVNIPRHEMELYEKEIIKCVTGLDKKYHVVICGSYRRGMETSNDIDVLITHQDFHIKQKEDLKCFTQSNEKYYNISRNKNGLNYILKHLKDILLDTLSTGKYKYMGFCKLDDLPVRRIDIRYVPIECFTTGMLYFTGSMELNKTMRQKAISKKMKLSEYGLYDQDNRMINIVNEQDIFNILEIDYLEPSKRN